MLQPTQLRDVLDRFPAEIAEVRAFLVSGGVRAESPDALRQVVDRIATDRGFHRDLGSHAWMLLFGGAQVPDVLRALALAALGERLAAHADEDDAHELLRFVMEARHAMAAKPAPAARHTGDAPSAAPVSGSPDPRNAALESREAALETDCPVVSPALRRSPETAAPGETLPPDRPQAAFQPGTLRSITPAISVAPTAAEDALPTARRIVVDDSPRRGRWLVLAACLLLALAAMWWFLRRPSVNTSMTLQTVPVVDGTASEAASPATPETVAPPSAPSAESATFSRQPAPARTVTQSALASRAGRQPPGKPSPAGPRLFPPESRASAPYPVASASPPPTTHAIPEAATPAPIARVAAAPSAGVAPLIRPAAAAPKTAAPPVPASVLAGRLGSPAANDADAVDDRVAGTRGYPRLLRRKPPDNGTLVAKNEAVPFASVPSRPVPGGTVRSTALGISAGNLVYAPDPAYPAAAALQHVTGQVTVQAMVDREGNVASARVISGPPMLRDAAVSAVQQWRYRPFTAGGKPQTFTATAVMEFQLQ